MEHHQKRKRPWSVYIVAGFALLVVAFFAYQIFLKSSTDSANSPEFSIAKKAFASSEGLSVFVPDNSPDQISASIVNSKGEEVGIRINEKEVDGGTEFEINPPRSFIPGKYTFRVVSKNGQEYTQDFQWGVLAINTNKAVYAPGEEALLSLAVLDETGLMVCDANVELRITNKDLGINETLTTQNGRIIVNPECNLKDYTEKPDYEASYNVGGVGKYEMELTAVTKNGTYTITDFFQVKNSAEVPFIIERKSATRIYPIRRYPVNLTITANSDFSGVIKERVPHTFLIYKNTSSAVYTEELDDSETSNPYKTKTLSWNIDIKKGQTINLSYIYDSPNDSPYFFLLGPLEFYSGNKIVYSEERNWQIAVDVITEGDGLLTYGESGSADLIDRDWPSGGTLGSAGTAITAEEAIRYVKTKASPIRDELISVAMIAISGTDTSLVASRYVEGSDAWIVDWCRSTAAAKTYGGTSCTQDSNLPSNANTAFIGFDLEYETTTGNAMVIYSRNASGTAGTAYMLYDNEEQTWSGPTTITTTNSTAVVSWLDLASKPTTDANELTVLYADENNDLWANVWSGGSSPSWTERSGALETDLEAGTAASVNMKSFDGEYETTTGDFLGVWGINNIADLGYATRTSGGAWSVTSEAAWIDIISVVDIAADPGSDDIVLGSDADVNVGTAADEPSFATWDGSAWANINSVIATSSNASASMITTGAGWLREGDGTRKAVVIWGDAAATSVSYAFIDPDAGSPAWSITTFALGATSAQTTPIEVVMNPFDNTEFIATVGKSTQLRGMRFTMSGGTISISDAISPAGSLATLAVASIYSPFSFSYFIGTETNPIIEPRFKGPVRIQGGVRIQ